MFMKIVKTLRYLVIFTTGTRWIQKSSILTENKQETKEGPFGFK